ncbi:MAG: L-lysine 2,3-aminomutase [Chlamydiales bacterium]|nr:L-lysine 2,3-aminomutase [Chlamydiales bacterium]MCH9635974.1 L-lysine 2,3-aminomutase [Chlamydiales bacterium]MCH9704450.1 KamA family radical SAM protein [Chlamydiota bacterium]
MWREIQRTNFRKLQPLLDFLKLDDSQRQMVEKNDFALNLPQRLAHKMEKGTLDDPLVRQFLPLVLEKEPCEGFSSNPVGDDQAKCGTRLLKKYRNRALLMPTAACAMHCRYCFRRHFDYGVSDLSSEIKQIESDKDLNEIILSGGDPLSLSDDRLEEISDKLPAHIKRLRFHTRFPVGIPERIDASFLAFLEKISQQVWFLVHINHANELDLLFFEKMREIARLGIPVLTQTVLLKGVNDSVDCLQRLFEELVDNGIQPYYLHQLDRVEGAVHFEVSGHELMEELAKNLSGYALPKYVREVAGMPYKVPL